MKKVTLKVERIMNGIFAGMISILGFSSCHSTELMYGTPTADFEIKGSVTDESGQAVEGASVTMRYINSNGAQAETKTDSKGSYLLKTSGWPENRIWIVCKPEGNNLEADSLDMTVSFKDSDGAWNHGTARETVDFSLKFKK